MKLTVIGHELRYLPRKEEQDPRNPGMYQHLDAGYIVITRLQYVRTLENGQKIWEHWTLRTSQGVLPDDFGMAAQTLAEIDANNQVGTDMDVPESQWPYMKEGVIWATSKHPVSPRQGWVIGHVAIYEPAEEVVVKGKKFLCKPQVIPFLSVLVQNDLGMDSNVHIRILPPGHEQAMVGDGTPTETMKALYGMMNSPAQGGAVLGTQLLIACENGCYVLGDATEGQADSAASSA